MRGFTLPLLPVIWIDGRLATEFGACTVAQGPGKVALNAKQQDAVQTLLHEAAHQLWAIWPEWRLWLGRRDVYGPERNAADALAEAVMRAGASGSRYATRELCYVSPLARMGLVRRR
jgi:hypothetical protein